MWLFKPDALIRAVLHLNPEELSDEEWTHQARMAEWTMAVLREGRL
jgi:hypothetical protein|nr:MAG TPA: hypothetical protein [Caudoviricetes sp.]